VRNPIKRKRENLIEMSRWESRIVILLRYQLKWRKLYGSRDWLGGFGAPTVLFVYFLGERLILEISVDYPRGSKVCSMLVFRSFRNKNLYFFISPYRRGGPKDLRSDMAPLLENTSSTFRSIGLIFSQVKGESRSNSSSIMRARMWWDDYRLMMISSLGRFSSCAMVNWHRRLTVEEGSEDVRDDGSGIWPRENS
jgi:hypothetical protein